MHEILFIDTETGGLDPVENSLLSIGLVFWRNNQIIHKKEVFIMEPIIRFTPESLKVHQIDFKEFIQQAIPPHEAIKQIKEFCNTLLSTNYPITLGGHNVAFDILFLKRLLRQDFSQLFSHRSIDTASILKFLFMSGKLDSDYSPSDDAFKHFNIEITNRHSAIGDAIATAELYTKLVTLMKQ